MDLPRIHEVECASYGLGNGFLDRPEQGECVFQISVRRPQGVLKLLYMEDPVKGVFPPELVYPRHVDADIGLIPTEGGPKFPSTLAEGDGRALIFSQQETGPAKRTADHLNRESGSVGVIAEFPKWAFYGPKVIPKDGDKAMLLFSPVRPSAFEGFGGTRQGCIEDRPPSMNETHGMECYCLAILYYIQSHLSRAASLMSREGSV